MSVVFTGTLQGSFTSTGAAVVLQIPTGVDYIRVYNTTQSYAAGSGNGAEFYWQLGMTQGRGTIYTKTTSTNALTVAQIAANAGFYLINSTVNVPGASVALTQIDGSTPPIVSTGSTAGLIANSSVVRLYNVVGAQQLGGLDFTVGTIVTNTSFTLAYGPTIVTTGATTGTYRIIPYDPYYYPTRRIITNITQAANAVITFSVSISGLNSYSVGMKLRLHVPTVTATDYGMTQADGAEVTIIAVNAATNTVTTDLNTLGFSAFSFPLTADPSFTPAVAVPYGENTAEALLLNANILADSTVNQGYFGLQLQGGTGSPAGSNSDVIYWVAGKSFNT